MSHFIHIDMHIYHGYHKATGKVASQLSETKSAFDIKNSYTAVSRSLAQLVLKNGKGKKKVFFQGSSQ